MSVIGRHTFFSGGDGKFGVNAETGDIFIIGRQMFEDEKVYRLAVSAQAIGAANKSSTPTQVVSVQVGYRAPQLYLDPYNVSVYENDSANDMQVLLLLLLLLVLLTSFDYDIFN